MTAGIAVSDLDAYSQMAKTVRDGCNGAAMQAVLGGTSKLGLEYLGVLYQDTQDVQTPFARFVINQSGVRKRTLSRPSRVTKQGMVDIQVIVPRSTPNAARVGRSIAGVLQTALVTPTEDVVYYTPFVKDMPGDDRAFVWRVQATFNYDVLEG